MSCPAQICSLSRHRLIPSSASSCTASYRQLRKSPVCKASRRQPRTLTSRASPATEVSSRQSQNRSNLRQKLITLSKVCSTYSPLPRLQLALHGLQELSGEETIRIALLATPASRESFEKVKKFLHLLLADPLSNEEEWERVLLDHAPGAKPLLIKVGKIREGSMRNTSRLMQEVWVDSPRLKVHNLEFLLLEDDAALRTTNEDGLLCPVVTVPTSIGGRIMSVPIPVHRMIAMGDGIMGAAQLLASLAKDKSPHGSDIIRLVDLPKSAMGEIPGTVGIDTELGSRTLSTFRNSSSQPTNLAFGHTFYESNIPRALENILAGIHQSDSELRPILQSMIADVLTTTSTSIEEHKRRQLKEPNSDGKSNQELKSLEGELSSWTRNAHHELQTELELAFTSKFWRKLAWWKLFWRVDDIAMIMSDVLSSRFLVKADLGIVYLTGVMAGRGLPRSSATASTSSWAYRPYQEHFAAPQSPSSTGEVSSENLPPKIDNVAPWPLHITDAREKIATSMFPMETLAQKLVLQTLSTSSLSCTLSVLMYISDLSTGIYESGAVAALGTIWALRRLQRRWESARAHWVADVREEGRQAIRGVEIAVRKVLRRVDDSPAKRMDLQEIEEAEQAVAAAKEALQACSP